MNTLRPGVYTPIKGNECMHVLLRSMTGESRKVTLVRYMVWRTRWERVVLYITRRLAWVA